MAGSGAREKGLHGLAAEGAPGNGELHHLIFPSRQRNGGAAPETFGCTNLYVLANRSDRTKVHPPLAALLQYGCRTDADPGAALSDCYFVARTRSTGME